MCPFITRITSPLFSTHTHTHFQQQQTSISKMSQKNFTLCCLIQVLMDLSTSSLESHLCPRRSSFIFGKRWQSYGTKSGLFGRCHEMVRGSFSVASVVVQEVWGPALSCCGKLFFLCFQALLNHCFKEVSVAFVVLWVDGCPRFKEVHVNNTICIPKTVPMTFPAQAQVLWLIEAQCAHQHSHHHKQPAFSREFQLERILWHSKIQPQHVA